MKIYELKPITSQKSFYGKAIVEVDDNGDETLYSYNTPIIKKMVDGTYKKLWNGWTATTGKHIKAFSGLNKAAFMGLEQEANIMKTFNEIQKEIENTYKLINKKKEKLDQLIDTHSSIKDIKEKINCSFYISERYIQEYHIIPLEFSNNDFNIECGSKCIDGKHKKLLDENKIQALELSDITLYYASKEYIDNIPKRIKDLKRLYKKAYEKQQELAALCSEYNNLAVGNIKNIYKDKNIYPTMEI